MSNFNCEKCGTALLDTPQGYITECEHYPFEGNSKFVVETDEELELIKSNKEPC